MPEHPPPRANTPQRAQIFSTNPLHPAVIDSLKTLGAYTEASAPTPEAILREGTKADFLIVRAPVPAEYFRANPALRAVVRHGAGLDMVPMQAANAAGVLVCNVPGANATTVAEHALFAALALLRQFRAMDARLRSTGWASARALTATSGDLAGRRLGILGYGNIGRALTTMARGFGLTLAATTPRPETLPADVTPLSLDALCATCDILVLCCPLTPATQGAISARRIASLPPGAILINVARGPVIDETALVAALQTRRISAALDVFDTEPLPADSPLWSLENVLLTPHVAGVTEASMRRMGETCAAEIARMLQGRLPLNLCNPETLPAHRRRFPAR